MKLWSKILIGFNVLLIILSVTTTFYKGVILQDFEIITSDVYEDRDATEEVLDESSTDEVFLDDAAI